MKPLEIAGLRSYAVPVDVPSISKQPIIFYDGVCALCNWCVTFTLKHDKAGRFHFAALQSEVAKKLLQPYEISPQDLNTVVLLCEGRVYLKSDAVLKVLAYLGWPWSLCGVAKILPRFVRDFFYDCVAKFRYRMFGKLDVCPLPSADTRSRFVDFSQAP